MGSNEANEKRKANQCPNSFPPSFLFPFKVLGHNSRTIYNKKISYFVIVHNKSHLDDWDHNVNIPKPNIMILSLALNVLRQQGGIRSLQHTCSFNAPLFFVPKTCYEKDHTCELALCIFRESSIKCSDMKSGGCEVIFTEEEDGCIYVTALRGYTITQVIHILQLLTDTPILHPGLDMNMWRKEHKFEMVCF
jgi:hypothetical protein